MGTLAHWLTRGVDALLSPFDLGPEWLGLVLFSVLSGVVILWAFGKMSSQRRLGLARDAMTSAILEIRIFGDSPLRIVTAQARLVKGTAIYMALTLPAFLILSIPLGLIFLRMETRHGLEPLDREAPVLVKTVLAPGTDAHQVKVVEEGNVRTTAPPLYVKSTRELYFRLAAPHDARAIRIRVGESQVEKDLATSGRFVSAERSSGIAALVALTREPPLPASSGIESISIHHAARSVRMLVSLPWWVHWFVVSSVAAVSLRKRLGVVI